MNLLQNTSIITYVNRYAVVGLVFALLLTTGRVQVVDAAEQAALLPDWTAYNATMQTTQERGIAVPVGKFINEIARSENKPAKKWNVINAPDMDTKPNYSSENAVRTMFVPTSAYTSDPAETDSTPFTTADGSRVRDGIVAANFLPIGTRIRIPDYFGNKVFEVHDRMNKRYWERVDIWMLQKKDAYSWGVRTVKIEILP